MILFAIGGITYGMAEETLVFFPILIPFLLAAGFDTMTACAVILIGSTLGGLGSTLNLFSIGIASDAAGIGIGELVPWSIIFPKFTFFETSLKAIQKVPILGDLLGLKALPFGSWSLNEMTQLCLWL